MSSYNYVKAWFDFAFENPDILTPAHTAVYMWNVELNNRMGWVKKFASPASQTMAACGIKSYKTYKKVFDDLVELGFIEIVTKAVNAHTANIVTLVNFTEVHTNALTKAVTMHIPKQVQPKDQRTSHIIRQTNKETIKQETINTPLTPQGEFADENFDVNENADVALAEATANIVQLNTGNKKRKKVAEKKENAMLQKFIEIYKAQFPDVYWQKTYDGKIDKISGNVLMLFKTYQQRLPEEEEWLDSFSAVLKNLDPFHVEKGIVTPHKILEHWSTHLAHLKKVKDGKQSTYSAKPSHTEQHNALKQYARTLSDVG